MDWCVGGFVSCWVAGLMGCWVAVLLGCWVEGLVGFYAEGLLGWWEAVWVHSLSVGFVSLCLQILSLALAFRYVDSAVIR